MSPRRLRQRSLHDTQARLRQDQRNRNEIPLLLPKPCKTRHPTFGQRIVEKAATAVSTQQSMPPVPHKSHLDRLVGQVQGSISRKQFSDSQATKFVLRREKPQDPNFELIIVHVFAPLNSYFLIKSFFENGPSPCSLHFDRKV